MPDFRANCCTRYRYRYSECRRCADACPHDAITLSDEGATLVADNCRNCGLCISACHTNAWSSPAFKPIDLLREAIKQPAWSLACEPSGCSGDAVVPCLGAIDAVWLAYMAKRRIPVTLHGSGHCADCVHGKTGEAQLTLNLAALDQLLEAATQGGGHDSPAPPWMMPVLAQDVRSPKAREKEVGKSAVAASRRQLFRRIFSHGGDTPVATSEAGTPAKVPEKAIRAGAYTVSEQRELLQIVCKQKDDRPFPVTFHEGLPLMQLSLQSGCMLCEACFRVCPTGALQIVENPGDWALTFQTDRCVACEVCLEVCQPRVLDAASAFDARPEQAPITLISRTKQRCSRCDRHFVSPTPEKTCSICSDDEDAFAAIFGEG
ncbi:MAG: 4Fe-4S dicluster domain-containing protein [Rhodoferax sp.]|nr:4Fe-4S dicluster domain-containing protein [Rhodoferax sp.]